MKTNNPKIIGITMLAVGLSVLLWQSTIVYKMIVYPFTENIVEAKVIGFKISRNGARMVSNSSGIKTAFSGRSPFFEFETSDKKTIKTYSKALQIFTLLNYEMGEKIKVAYSTKNPEKAIILSYKEIPGILFMLIFSILILIIGKNYLKI